MASQSQDSIWHQNLTKLYVGAGLLPILAWNFAYVSLLSWLQLGWGIIGSVLLGLRVAQYLMQQEHGLQAEALLPSFQELLNTINRLKLVWIFSLAGPFYLHYCFTSLYPMYKVLENNHYPVHSNIIKISNKFQE